MTPARTAPDATSGFASTSLTRTSSPGSSVRDETRATTATSHSWMRAPRSSTSLTTAAKVLALLTRQDHGLDQIDHGAFDLAADRVGPLHDLGQGLERRGDVVGNGLPVRQRQ